jgi:uncharacterized membrane protein YhaH (DUF805 family)
MIITFLYLLIIAAYNLLGDNYAKCILFGNEVYYWRVIYFFSISITTAILFLLIRGKSIGKKRNIYLCGAIFSILYALYEIATLTSKKLSDYLYKINSELWSIISFSIIALIIIYLIIYCYDSTNKRTID